MITMRYLPILTPWKSKNTNFNQGWSQIYLETCDSDIVLRLLTGNDTDGFAH